MLVIHVRDRSLADLAAAALVATDQSTDVDDATAPSFQGLAAIEEAGGTTILTGAAEYLALADRLLQVTAAEIVSVLADDASDTYGWFVLAPTTRRQRVLQAGALVSDEGDPTPEEDGVETLDQETVLELLEQRTGVVLPWAENARATLLAPG